MSELNCVVTVCLDGHESTTQWPRSTALLDTLLDSGIDVPYSCRQGSCCACVCKVVRGKVAMTDNHALEESDIAMGYILACQALPDSDEIQVTYDD